ncbi:hypothetical protein DH09_00430 (plasmid) [Bacillaceae bacterium JMAK1]|nr:hypothetical protein DH09_00430 [Bacillaceae bacterium JMAK1]
MRNRIHQWLASEHSITESTEEGMLSSVMIVLFAGLFLVLLACIAWGYDGIVEYFNTGVAGGKPPES